jgi:hypothetical protein
MGLGFGSDCSLPHQVPIPLQWLSRCFYIARPSLLHYLPIAFTELVHRFYTTFLSLSHYFPITFLLVSHRFPAFFFHIVFASFFYLFVAVLLIV